MRAAALIGALLLALPAAAQTDPAAAVRARVAQLESLVPSVPDPSLAYLIAADYAELGDKPKALEWLARAADARAGFDPRHPSFTRFAADPD